MRLAPNTQEMFCNAEMSHDKDWMDLAAQFQRDIASVWSTIPCPPTLYFECDRNLRPRRDAARIHSSMQCAFRQLTISCLCGANIIVRHSVTTPAVILRGIALCG